MGSLKACTNRSDKLQVVGATAVRGVGGGHGPTWAHGSWMQPPLTPMETTLERKPILTHDRASWRSTGRP